MDISVIIPVKNGAKYLKRCLNSVFLQTFKGSYEVIVGVDPSIDRSLEIAREYQLSHPNLIVEERQGKGVQYNRMDSIKRAQGKYLCFLDVDDYYSKEYLEVMYNEIEKGYDVVNCSFKVDTNGKLSKNLFTKKKDFDTYGACKALLRDTYMRSFLWSKIFKRELFDNKLPIFKASDAMFEDTMTVFAIFMKINKVRSIRKPLYIYHNNMQSVTKNEKKERFSYHLLVFAYVRYLCDITEDKRYLKGFLRNFSRTRLSLWFDGHVSRHILGNGGRKELKKHKRILKDLKRKEKLDIEKYPIIKHFVEESSSRV